MTTEVQPVGPTTALHALVCLDGSTRAGDALAPAAAMAARWGEQVSVIALDPETNQQKRQLAEQLVAANVQEGAVSTVADRNELVTTVRHATAKGATPVLAAFGDWNAAGRLSGVLGELVRAGVSPVLAVGPRVASSHHSDRPDCIMVSADGVHAIDPLIDATRDFGGATTDRILVAHVVPPAEPGISYVTRRNSEKFRTEFNVVVETAAATGTDVATAIADLARRENASLIITRSWHTWQPNQPETASNSLAIAAEAPCPVAIVS